MTINLANLPSVALFSSYGVSARNLGANTAGQLLYEISGLMHELGGFGNSVLFTVALVLRDQNDAIKGAIGSYTIEINRQSQAIRVSSENLATIRATKNFLQALQDKYNPTNATTGGIYLSTNGGSSATVVAGTAAQQAESAKYREALINAGLATAADFAPNPAVAGAHYSMTNARMRELIVSSNTQVDTLEAQLTVSTSSNEKLQQSLKIFKDANDAILTAIIAYAKTAGEQAKMIAQSVA